MRIAQDQVLDISHENLQKIVRISGRNLRDAISQLECYKYSKKSDTDILHPFKPEIREIYKLLMSEQSAVQLQKIRGIFYDLLVNCIEGNLILKLLVEEIIFGSKIPD
jgi:replication factor C subunit 3/5